jgi:hypothetical protein
VEGGIVRLILMNIQSFVAPKFRRQYALTVLGDYILSLYLRGQTLATEQYDATLAPYSLPN